MRCVYWIFGCLMFLISPHLCLAMNGDVVWRTMSPEDTDVVVEVPEPVIMPNNGVVVEDLSMNFMRRVSSDGSSSLDSSDFPNTSRPSIIIDDDHSPSPPNVPTPSGSNTPAGNRLVTLNYSPQQERIQAAFHDPRYFTNREKWEIQVLHGLKKDGQWQKGHPQSAGEARQRFSDHLLAARALGREVRQLEADSSRLSDPKTVEDLQNLLQMANLHYATPEARRVMALLTAADTIHREWCAQHPEDRTCARQHEFA